MSERVSFNLNDIVFVRLTERGREVYREWRRGQHFQFNEVDTTGELRFQGWELMQVFGEEMSLGRAPPFEGLNIEVQTKDLTPVKRSDQ
jgi:hypothetical protein